MLQSRTLEYSQENEVTMDHLVNELKLTPLVAKLLVNRGIQTVEKAKEFLYQKMSFMILFY